MINIIEFEEEPFRRHIKTTFVTDNTESNSRTAKTTVSTIISDIHLPEINPNRFNVIVNNNLRERYFGDLDGKDLISGKCMSLIIVLTVVFAVRLFDSVLSVTNVVFICLRNGSSSNSIILIIA